MEYSTNRLAGASVSLAESSRLFDIAIGQRYIQRLALLRAPDKFTPLYGHQALGKSQPPKRVPPKSLSDGLWPT